ncbi:MAG: ABC transporter ATP-binding protein [Cellvibrionaceae bacterium]|nr:ABC transporter ATP-binding protein [Cellvibrionaceae bacterium]
MLQISQLSFGYHSQSAIIQNINTHLPSGCIAGLMGANGVGKSTLLKLIAGLLKPISGAIRANRHDSAKRSVGLLATLYFVPEKTWLPDFRADSFVKLYAPLYPRFDHSLFAQCRERFELPYPQNLQDYSYGQQKKFLIAFGIASRPRLFLLDEPTNGLDIPAKEQFRQLLLETADDQQSAIISTHQAHDLQGVIDTAMLMDRMQLLTVSLEKLQRSFSVEKFAVKPDNALYAAEHFNQWLCLVPFLASSQRELDLELLFKTFHLQKRDFLQHLNSEECRLTAQTSAGGNDAS